MIIDELFEAPQMCPECGGISFSNLILAEKKDACYHKVKASAKVWPSAYASGRLVQCRKKGAANYGNKSEGVAEGIEGSVVFSGTGDNGGKYEIIQSGPNDFMIHANGKHIDSYDSLQRAMSVLQNEVPGLTKGVAEGSLEEGVNDPHIFKAIAMIGPMGAGKSTIARQLVGGSGLRSLNLDNFNELLIKQGKVAGGNLTPDQLERSWQLTQAQKGNWVDGRLGLLIDGSGRNVEGLVKPLMQLEALGYDTMVILVNVSLETSLQRQQSRAAQQAQQYGTGRNVPADLAKSSYDQIQQNIPKLQQLYGNKLLIINNEGTVDLEQEKTIVDRFLSAPPSKPAAVEWIKSQGASQGQQLDKRLAQQQRQQSSAQRAPTYKQQDVAETRRGQIPMTLKPGETDDLEPEDFEGFKQLPEYLEGQKAQQKAGKDLIQQSPYTYQSDQDWAYRNGAFDARQAASSADFTKRGPLTTEQGMAEAKRKKKSSRKSDGYFFPGYGYYGSGESGEGGGDGGESVNRGMSESWRDIYNLNKQKIGTNPNLIKTDTVLKMPDGSRYKVKPGDNLSSIAKTSATKRTPAKSNNPNTKSAVEPKYYSLPPAAAKPAPAVQNDRPYEFDPRSGKIGVNPSGIADVFRNTERPPSLTRDEIEQQMMQPDLAGPAAPGFRHTVQGPEGKEYDFDSEQEARDFVDRIKQLDIKDRESQGLGAAKSESINGTVKEVSLGDYRKKAQVSQAGAKINKFFDRDNPEAVARADQTIAKRERGMARADARRKPYTPPSVDMEKQRQELTDKYPNIDELVRKAELRRDPDYEMADGQAYYAGQEAEQKYQRLKQIQRIIQGLNEETRQATVNTPAGNFTANITKDKSTNTVSGTMPVGGATLSAKKDLTPGGAQSVTVDTDVAPNLNISATRKSADYNKGQLAGTKSVSAKYTDTTGALGKPGQQHTATRTAGVGFGGASGARVGKNYVTQIDKTLSDYMDEAKGINSIRNPNDLQPLEAGGGMGGGGGTTRSGPSPFGPKPGSREASVSITTPNTMTVKQGPNPDYVPPKTLQQKYDELNKKLDQLPPAPPVKVPRPGRAASDQRQKDQAQAPELKDVVPLSPAERDRLRPVDANKMRRSEINKEPPDLSSVRPGLDEQSRKKREQPEVEYDDDYDAMVARVRKLAGLGPREPKWDPEQRRYRMMPTAVQPKK